MPDIQQIPMGDGAILYSRTAFNEAGQSSYNEPPAEEQEPFSLLLNTLPVTKGVLERRWGIAPQVALGAAIRGLYEHQSAAGSRSIIALTDAGNVLLQESPYSVEPGTGHPYYEQTLAVTNPTIFARSANALKPRCLNSRGYSYYSDGVEADLQKTNGVVTSAWGLDINAATGFGLSAVLAPTLGEDISTTPPYNHTAVAWTNPNNAISEDSVTADATVAPLNTTHGLRLSHFGLAYSAATKIKSAQATIKFVPDASVPYPDNNLLCTIQWRTSLGVVGIQSTFFHPNTTSISFPAYEYEFTPDIVNDDTFGFEISIQSDLRVGDPRSPNYNIHIDSGSVVLAVSGGAPTLGAPTTGSITLANGRKYCLAFVEAATRHCSDITPFTASTGILSAKQVPLSDLAVSTNPVVSTKVLLATADGGDETTLYLVAELPNSQTTYTDNMTEEDLLTQNTYLEVDDFGIEHGITGNTPPPNSSIFCKHKGRMFALVGTTLYFSKSLDELTTSTGLIVGRYEEAWPRDNLLDISASAEIGKALFSDGNCLYIITERHVRRLFGDGPQNFAQPEIAFNAVGIVDQECMKVIFVQGQPAGCMWLTPDKKLIHTDFNTYQSAGDQIQDIFDNINEEAMDKIFAEYFGVGGYSFYAIGIPTDQNFECDTLCVFDTNKKKWHIWKFPTTFASALFSIDSKGIPHLLLGDTAGLIYSLDTHSATRVDTIETGEIWVGTTDMYTAVSIDRSSTELPTSGDIYAVVVGYQGGTAVVKSPEDGPVTIGGDNVDVILTVPAMPGIDTWRIYWGTAAGDEQYFQEFTEDDIVLWSNTWPGKVRKMYVGWGFSVGGNLVHPVQLGTPPVSVADPIQTPYKITCDLLTPWLHFGDPTIRKDLNEIEVITDDSAMTFTLEGASNSAEFESPNSILTASPLKQSLFGEWKFFLAALPTIDRFYHMRFTSADSDNPIFLRGYRVELIPEHKL